MLASLMPEILATKMAMSGRLRMPDTAFRTHGVNTPFTRARVRRITIMRIGGADHE
jgi:hypothetical protein